MASLVILAIGSIAFIKGIWIPYHTPFPQIIGQNCGQVEHSDLDSQQTLEIGYAFDPNDAEGCLQHAYATCQTATLLYILAGADVGTTYTVTTQCGGGKSRVTDANKTDNPENPFQFQGVTINHCAGITPSTASYDHTVKGLLIYQCGWSADIFLPERPPNQKGLVCGTIHSAPQEPVDSGNFYALPGEDPQQVTDCFWQGYTSCVAPSTLVFIVATYANSVTTWVEHTLIAQPLNGACALTDATTIEIVSNTHTNDSLKAGLTYTCASLSRDAHTGYITAHHCGAEGDVAVAPPTRSTTPTPTATS
jgi:hypothetical protein